MQENLFFGIKETATGCNVVELSKEEFRNENRNEYPLTLDYGAQVSLNWSDDKKKFIRGLIVFYKGNAMDEWYGTRGDWAMDVICEISLIDSRFVKGRFRTKVRFVDRDDQVIDKSFDFWGDCCSQLLVEIFSVWSQTLNCINVKHLNLVEDLNFENFCNETTSYNYDICVKPHTYDECVSLYRNHYNEVEIFIVNYKKELTDKMISSLRAKVKVMKEYINKKWPDNKI